MGLYAAILPLLMCEQLDTTSIINEQSNLINSIHLYFLLHIFALITKQQNQYSVHVNILSKRLQREQQLYLLGEWRGRIVLKSVLVLLVGVSISTNSYTIISLLNILSFAGRNMILACNTIIFIVKYMYSDMRNGQTRRKSHFMHFVCYRI